MKLLIGGILFVAVAALPLFSGCSSSSPASSGAGGAGGGGAGGALGMGGKPGTGGFAGVADAGADKNDGGNAAMAKTDGNVADDAAVDAPAATLTQIWSTILSDLTNPDTSPSCVGCHDGSPGIPDYTSVAMTYATLVGVASTSCSGIRVTPGNAETSVLVNKLRAKPNLGLGVTVCGGMPMPLGDTRSITLEELHMIETWINAGALNN